MQRFVQSASELATTASCRGFLYNTIRAAGGSRTAPFERQRDTDSPDANKDNPLPQSPPERFIEVPAQVPNDEAAQWVPSQVPRESASGKRYPDPLETDMTKGETPPKGTGNPDERRDAHPPHDELPQ